MAYGGCDSSSEPFAGGALSRLSESLIELDKCVNRLRIVGVGGWCWCRLLDIFYYGLVSTPKDGRIMGRAINMELIGIYYIKKVVPNK